MTEQVNLTDTTVIKAGNAFCVALRDGRLPLASNHPLGAYLNDCRYLRGHELWLAGRTPRLLIATAAAGTAAVYELTNPDLVLPDGQELPLQSMRLRIERRMLPAGMTERISIHSHARVPVELALELRFDADFQPMLEVRGLADPVRRDIRTEARGDTLMFAATGLDGEERSTTIFCPGAAADGDGRLRVGLCLAPGEERTLDIAFQLAEGDADQLRIEGRASISRAAQEADAWLADRTQVSVDEELVGRVLRRSLLDLRLLESDLDGSHYFAAGVPWYATLFGRDSIIAAQQTLAFDPSMAAETLRLLAGRLGTRMDDRHEEEPGKVLHELRLGELAATEVTPLVRYYGTVDATPLFLCLLAEHAHWVGSLDLFRELRSEVEQALRWIDEFGDLDSDGLLEYHCRSPGGLENQGWKDTWDGVPDENGAPLRQPIALVEPQGYAIAAKRGLAPLFDLDGERQRAEELREGASRLASALDRFWLADRGFYSIGLDREKRPSRALASNQGHLLWARAVSPERAAAIRDALMAEAMHSGWGVRTLAAGERAFNPVGYHTGTIWPHDNSLFAVGLRNYTFDEEFLRIFEGLLDAASAFPDYRLPELFAGFSRTEYEDPVPYPVACSPQAWAAGSLPTMLIAGLGLVPDGLRGVLRIRRPSLPRQVNRLELQGLRVSEARVNLLFERIAPRADSVALSDVQVEGSLDVVLEIPRAGELGDHVTSAS
jgi:glycogen debranching enzyme